VAEEFPTEQELLVKIKESAGFEGTQYSML
jgi:hypothetical protein